MSFDHTHYVAAVRWKQAEMESLQWLSKREKTRLTPLIELIPRNFRASDGEAIPVREALRKIAGEIDSHWGFANTFVDVEHVVKAGICENCDHPHVLEILAIPLT